MAGKEIIIDKCNVANCKYHMENNGIYYQGLYQYTNMCYKEPFDNCENNKESFVGYYCKIIQKVRLIQPQSKIFVMTVPKEWSQSEELSAKFDRHAEFIRSLPNVFKNVYVLDFRKYAPIYDKDFDDKYRMGSHLNPAGYLLTARMVESYIDYIIRKNYKDFSQVGFIGTGLSNINEKPL